MNRREVIQSILLCSFKNEEDLFFDASDKKIVLHDVLKMASVKYGKKFEMADDWTGTIPVFVYIKEKISIEDFKKCIVELLSLKKFKFRWVTDENTNVLVAPKQIRNLKIDIEDRAAERFKDYITLLLKKRKDDPYTEDLEVNAFFDSENAYKKRDILENNLKDIDIKQAIIDRRRIPVADFSGIEDLIPGNNKGEVDIDFKWSKRTGYPDIVLRPRNGQGQTLVSAPDSVLDFWWFWSKQWEAIEIDSLRSTLGEGKIPDKVVADIRKTFSIQRKFCLFASLLKYPVFAVFPDDADRKSIKTLLSGSIPNQSTINGQFEYLIRSEKLMTKIVNGRLLINYRGFFSDDIMFNTFPVQLRERCDKELKTNDLMSIEFLVNLAEDKKISDRDLTALGKRYSAIQFLSKWRPVFRRANLSSLAAGEARIKMTDALRAYVIAATNERDGVAADALLVNIRGEEGTKGARARWIRFRLLQQKRVIGEIRARYGNAIEAEQIEEQRRRANI